MKKIIESELISIAHRILKLKDKADIDALYNESKNVFEKISVLKFYEDNRFRIDTNITDEVIENALFSDKNKEEDFSKESVVENKEVVSSDMNHSNRGNVMDLDLINELIEESEKSDIVSFDDEILDEVPNQIQDTVDEFIEELNIDLSIEVTSHFQESIDDEIIELDKNQKETIEIDPIFNLQLEDIKFEEKFETDNENDVVTKEVVEVEKQPSFENQHLMNSSDGYEMPFHQVPLNRTINDAFSHVITIGLNDRIAFEKNLFDGSSEDLNRVLSQLNTIENFQEAQDFIDDLVKPDFNYWKGKEEFEERFMQLIQKRFL